MCVTEEVKEADKEGEKTLNKVEEVLSEEGSIDWIRKNFQPSDLCSEIKTMKAFEDDDYEMITLNENDMEDRMEKNIKAMVREINKRKKVIELLGQGKKYYDSLYEEAEIVAIAYRHFGQRVKIVALKLAEQREGTGLVPSLTQAGGHED